MKTLSFFLTYAAVVIWLFVKFPLIMIPLFLIMLVIMSLLMKNAPYDYEIYPELYKKPPIS